MSSIRVFRCLAARLDLELELEQLDVKNAFLHGDMEEELYISFLRVRRDKSTQLAGQSQKDYQPAKPRRMTRVPSLPASEAFPASYMRKRTDPLRLSARTESIRIDWGAYPHYHAPERFAPFILDGAHLYYVNAFENAASTMETSAVAAENIARLILSRLSREHSSRSLGLKTRESVAYDCLHEDL
ncbi:hypothetical protein RJ640_008201 [Escallonia rubra]|uniref:Prenylcysteine lyase domain-containing protein n=1 Tax=Escallonia rubra TaxID=112253 RepID=A0AA88R6W3_9ASTE|nr:hypothetical protein RJ640_008201 [Escallonia rubra]